MERKVSEKGAAVIKRPCLFDELGCMQVSLSHKELQSVLRLSDSNFKREFKEELENLCSTKEETVEDVLRKIAKCIAEHGVLYAAMMIIDKLAMFPKSRKRKARRRVANLDRLRALGKSYTTIAETSMIPTKREATPVYVTDYDDDDDDHPRKKAKKKRPKKAAKKEEQRHYVMPDVPDYATDYDDDDRPRKKAKKKRPEKAAKKEEEQHYVLPNVPIVHASKEDILKKIREMNGRELTKIAVKKLTTTDLKWDQVRLLLPLTEMLNHDFLTASEKNFVDNKVKIPALLLDQSSLNWETHFNKREMTDRWYYVLLRPWNCVCKRSNYKKDDIVEVWSFRYDEIGLENNQTRDKLGFAVIKI